MFRRKELTILHNGLGLQRIDEATFDALASAYTRAGRFCCAVA